MGRTGLSADRVDLIRRGVQARLERRPTPTIRAINRVVIDVSEGLSYRCTNLSEPAEVMAVDEPTERGGSGKGASPLSHFLAGVGSCLLNQFVRIAIADGLPIEFARAQVNGEFRRDPGGAFERIATDVYARGTLSTAEAEDLIERAEALCYVHNTLARAVRMTTVLHLDGREVARRES